MKNLLIFLALIFISNDLLAYDSYYAPYKGGTKIKVSQGYDGAISHYGADLAYALDFSGEFDIYAPNDGIVDEVGTNSYKIKYCIDNPEYWHGDAKYIRIKHNDGLYTYYYHLNSVNLKKGDSVIRGKTVLGVSGNTGCSTATHLHFQFSKQPNMSRSDSVKISFSDIGIPSSGSYYESKNYPLSISRSAAVKLILDKFNISSNNAGFNSSRFGESINIPSDVNSNTLNYDSIVTAYNRGIASGSNATFRPNDDVSFAEFLIMIIRAIPIPIDNPDYKSYDYNSGEWYYKYAKTAYNANLIDNISYSFNDAIDETLAKEILDKAYNYFMGSDSGISIYARWTKKYADIDLYLYSIYDGDGTEIEHDSSYVISNMSSLKYSGGIVYWDNHSSDWGTNLDYDSWGANGSQPWTGTGEERITVDSQMVRRPGKYSIIFCYYDWNNYENPSDANVEWWGINRGQNINTGGENFNRNIKKGDCVYSGTLNTN